jgi:hypothetical protein
MSYARSWRYLLRRARSIPNKEANRGDDDREEGILYRFSFRNRRNPSDASSNYELLRRWSCSGTLLYP